MGVLGALGSPGMIAVKDRIRSWKGGGGRLWGLE